MGTKWLPDMRPSVVGSVLPYLAQLLREFELEPASIARRAGVDPSCFERDGRPLSLPSLARLLEVGAHEALASDFGIRLAQARGVPDFGPVASLLREQGNLRSALQMLNRELHFQSDGLILELQDRDEPLVLIGALTQGESCPQLIASFAGGVVSLMRWLVSPGWSPSAVFLTRPKPARTQSHVDFFGCPVYFASDIDAVALRPEELDAPLLPPGAGQPGARAAASIKTSGQDGTAAFANHVMQAVVARLPEAETGAEVVARRFGIDRRTLNRRLLRENTSFTGIVELVRRDVAQRYLAEGSRPITEIATLTGFSSASTFSRWFRGAFDRSPRTWRRSMLQSAESFADASMRRTAECSKGG